MPKQNIEKKTKKTSFFRELLVSKQKLRVTQTIS